MITAQGMDQIRYEEGVRLKKYRCSQGFWTIGIGRNIDANPYFNGTRIPSEITRQLADDIFHHDLNAVATALADRWPQFVKLTPPRRDAVINMAFQLGVNGFLNFRRMRAAIDLNDWYHAYREGFDSQWARQTPARAQRVMYQLLTNRWYPIP